MLSPLEKGSPLPLRPFRDSAESRISQRQSIPRFGFRASTSLITTKPSRGGTTGSGLVEGVFTGRLYVCRSDDRSGHERLDRYMSESGLLSVKAAIETDTTLGGACKALIVERMHAYGLYAVSSVDYFGAHFDVRVWG
jgi:hypothetical protein